MSKVNLVRRAFLGTLASAGSLAGLRRLFGEEPMSRDGKVIKATNQVPIDDKAPPPGDHPLDPALVIARDSLKNIRENIVDYTCFILKRERINGRAYDQETMLAKIRNRKTEDGKIKTPFSVYMKFVKPESINGREVAYVEGKNNGKLIAREAGITGKLAGILWLDPKGMLAMQGNRYPIMDIGIENLVVKLIERGERERKHDECVVNFRKNASINKRKCTVIEVIHPVRRAHFEFNLAQIFLDDDLQIPIRYAAYDWPAGKNENPEPNPSVETVLEEYTYLDVKLNVGLTDDDFVIKAR